MKSKLFILLFTLLVCGCTPVTSSESSNSSIDNRVYESISLVSDNYFVNESSINGNSHFSYRATIVEKGEEKREIVPGFFFTQYTFEIHHLDKGHEYVPYVWVLDNESDYEEVSIGHQYYVHTTLYDGYFISTQAYVLLLDRITEPEKELVPIDEEEHIAKSDFIYEVVAKEKSEVIYINNEPYTRYKFDVTGVIKGADKLLGATFYYDTINGGWHSLMEEMEINASYKIYLRYHEGYFLTTHGFASIVRL